MYKYVFTNLFLCTDYKVPPVGKEFIVFLVWFGEEKQQNVTFRLNVSGDFEMDWNMQVTRLGKKSCFQVI